MRIEKRTMNWLPRPSLHDEAEAARLKRRANAQDFLARQASNAGVFARVNSSAAGGAVDLTMNIAIARVKSGVKPKI